MTTRALDLDAIRRSQCPRPANAVPGHIQDWTVLDCLARDECGCDLGDALRGYGESTNYSKPNSSQSG